MPFYLPDNRVELQKTLKRLREEYHSEKEKFEKLQDLCPSFISMKDGYEYMNVAIAHRKWAIAYEKFMRVVHGVKS